MCNLNIFQVILGGLFVFTYLCLLRQPFFFFPQEIGSEENSDFFFFCHYISVGPFPALNQRTCIICTLSAMYLFLMPPMKTYRQIIYKDCHSLC